MHLLRRFAARSILALSILACGFAPAIGVFAQEPAVADAPKQQAPSWSLIDDEWTTMEIGGSRIGWMNTRVEQAGDQFRTITVSDIKVERGDVTVAMRMEQTYVETADGKPVSVKSVQEMSQQKVETTWMFKDGKVLQMVRRGSGGAGTPKTQVHDLPAGTWFTPYAAEQYVRAQRESGAKEITYDTLEPQESLTPMTITSTLQGEKEHQHDGRTTPVQVWKTVTSILKGMEGTEYYDPAEGEVVYHELPIAGLGSIVMRSVSKDEAMREVAGAGGPDIMNRSFAKPDKPIENSMRANRATLKITAKQGTLPDLPSAGSQRVTMSEDRRSAVLTIDIDDPLPACDEEKASDEFIKPSTMVDFDDELVLKISNAARDEKTEMKRAGALRKIVNQRISKKDMATAFASASETARTRSGDCSEHGVLLAAALRAQGIPSRVAMGLVYVDEFMGADGIFGWHMWTQALIDGKWVDLDATLPVRYNAAHILTSHSSLADGLGAGDMVSIMQLIGNIDIEVMEVSYAE
jgi:hypothetical protein